MMLYRDSSITGADVYYLEEKHEDYTVRIIAASEVFRRSDRKEIRVYVNGRPVDEYSIVQAVVYGYGELLPGGSYPYASVFIDDRAENVDFNIHPAKKEVKIRNIAEVHHTVSSMLKNGIKRKIPEIKNEEVYLFGEAEKKPLFRKEEFHPAPKAETEYRKSGEKENKENTVLSDRIVPYTPRDRDWLEKARELKRVRENELREKQDKEEKAEEEIKYIGQAFKLFLICERKNELYLVDQHAAHERILYDEIVSQKTVQKLLVPIKIEVDDITDEYLEKYSWIYTKLGIMLSRISKGNWEIDAVPAICRGIEDKIIDFVVSAKSDEHQLEEELFATMACRAAVKMGDEVDKYSAMEILRKVFAMDEPCCPHGRTFLVKLTKENLMKMVGRT